MIFVPNIPGTWVVNVRLIVEGLDDSIKYQMTFTIQVPDEGDTIISIVPIIEIENQTPLTIAGKVFHSNVSSCLVNIGEQKIVSPNEFGEFSYSWTCCVVFMYLFILTARRDMSIFIKINTF